MAAAGTFGVTRGASAPRGRPYRRWGIVALIAVLAVGVMAQIASAGSTGKLYTLDVSPSAVAGGSSTLTTLTLRNESTTQQIGSANLTPPTGFTITNPAPGTVVANVLQLRNLSLAPGASRSFSLTATAPCTAGTGVWNAQVKQANNFNGPPGNDFTFDAANSDVTITVGNGGCKLAFTGQPAAAETNAVITTTPINTPAGQPVQVSVVDANDNVVALPNVPITIALAPVPPTPAGATLSGTKIVSTGTDGRASFGNLSVDTHGTYVLNATSPGLTSATSTSFGIWDDAAACTGACSVTVTQTKQQSTQVNASSSTGALVRAARCRHHQLRRRARQQPRGDRDHRRLLQLHGRGQQVGRGPDRQVRRPAARRTTACPSTRSATRVRHGVHGHGTRQDRAAGRHVRACCPTARTSRISRRASCRSPRTRRATSSSRCCSRAVTRSSVDRRAGRESSRRRGGRARPGSPRGAARGYLVAGARLGARP